jgi:hypothetical protein
MPYRLLVVAVALLAVCGAALAQEPSPWTWDTRFEVRANYRWSDEERARSAFFNPAVVFLETPDPGHHVDLNVVDAQFDVGYGKWLAARAKVHAQAMHRRNPTSEDRQIDADELWVRIGEKPEFLERPERTSFFAQVGKFPKMERQPVRLLESYGLAATAFNRFEDLQLLVGGTVGRNFYWRVQAANGNPVFFRDPNALAGDNGTPDSFTGNAEYGSGFPIFYNAETEDLFFNTSNMQMGEALGYRWQSADENLGFDVIVFHYQRDLADTVDLYGTRYGGDLDLFTVLLSETNGLVAGGLMIEGRNKEETGARVYAEWGNATVIAQFTDQEMAGLERYGWEVEAGYRLPLTWGWIESIQPAVRASGLENTILRGQRFPTPSIWWDWQKWDAGVRIGLKRGLDITAEYTIHNTDTVVPFRLRETLVTVRWRS